MILYCCAKVDLVLAEQCGPLLVCSNDFSEYQLCLQNIAKGTVFPKVEFFYQSNCS